MGINRLVIGMKQLINCALNWRSRDCKQEEISVEGFA